MAEGSFDWTGLGALGTGIGALGSMATSFLNYGLSSKNFDYQKALQDRVFAREDTSLQRRMQDAKAAGLNPYSVINSGGASSGNVVRTEAPQMNLNTNGLIDTVNSILDIKQRQEQTKSLQLENANKAKTGLILNADLVGKEWQNKLYGQSFQSAVLNNAMLDLDRQRHLAEFNYDFDRNIYQQFSSDYGKTIFSEVEWPYNYNNPTPFNRMRNYDLLRAQQAADQSVYGTSLLAGQLDYFNDFTMPYGLSQLRNLDIRNQLMQKENDWYNFNQGYDKVTGAIDAVTGLLFRGLDFGLRQSESKSRNRLNNARSYQIYGENSGYYWDWNY